MKIRLFFAIVILFLTSCNGTRRQEKPHPPIGVPLIEEILPKPTINVYIENSGSMDGYVKGATEFKSTVFNYLSDIKISKTADSLNLNYINSKVIPQGTVSEELDVLRDFIEKLNPSTFKMKGGNRRTSDIADVIKAVLQKTDGHTISLLISDGIFSPGKGKDAEQYLDTQEIGIKNSFAAFLEKEKNAAVIVYQLSSNFNGTYFNKVDDKMPINEQRPFYIYVIGDAKLISNLRNKVPDSKFKGTGIQNAFISIAGNQEVKFNLNPSVGKYRRTRTPKTIEKLEKDRSGKICFAVNVDFSKLLLDDAYLTNSENYENNSNYMLEIKPNAKLGYTHTLYFSASDNKVHKGVVSVKLKAKFPDWIEKVNDTDGSVAVSGKTYGIKYQLSGIFDAFTFTNNDYTEIKINVN